MAELRAERAAIPVVVGLAVAAGAPRAREHFVVPKLLVFQEVSFDGPFSQPLDIKS